jgi:hypothetical protein
MRPVSYEPRALGLAATVLEVPSLRGASPSEELDSFELVSGQHAYGEKRSAEG